MQDLLHQFTEILRHPLEFLRDFTHAHQGWVYALLGAIVFAETGLVVLPFLPGDSLLFACGILAGSKDLDVWVVVPVLIAAALLGDNVNYWLGRYLGPRVLRGERVRLLNRKNLDRTRAFFSRHGGKSVVIARFVPIVRTFAPFTAGVGMMPYPRFLAFSVFGAVLWVGVCVTAGWYLGSLQFVREHFDLAVVAIVLVSLIPVLIGWARASREDRESAGGPEKKS